MSGHTKGPWKVEKMPDDGGEFSVFSKTGIYVALTVGGTDSEEANARLIAAAPDLLAMLERITTAAYNVGGEHVTDHQQLIDAADDAADLISRARGEA